MSASERLYAIPVYKLLLSLYAVQFGIRIGFLDFAILSGRFASVFAFSEIFLLPIFIGFMVRISWVRWGVSGVYFFIHSFLP